MSSHTTYHYPRKPDAAAETPTARYSRQSQYVTRRTTYKDRAVALARTQEIVIPDASPALVRSTISSRSNSASPAKIANTSRPLAVVVSIDAPSPARTFSPASRLVDDQVDEVAQIAAEPVELPHDQRVALQVVDLAAVSFRDPSIADQRRHIFVRLWSGPPMLIGYMRVSKADGSQVFDLQRDALLAAGIPADRLYEDQSSGKRDSRPGLEACLKALRRGDTLVAWKLDRLGRDLRHLVNLVHDLTGRAIGLKVLAGQGANLDTTTANGRLVFGIFAALAEFERDLIIERTRAGLASARARGRNGGRPFKMTMAKLRLAQAAMGQSGTKVNELCAELDISRQTLYRHVDPKGALRLDGEKLLGRKARSASAETLAAPQVST